MKRKAGVSIIISYYNGAKYILPCIKSCLNSSFQDYEIIVINDASTDASARILTEFQKNNRLRIFHFKNNLGPSKVRNFGVKQSKGDIILFLDMDVEIDHKCLKELVKKFNQNKNIGGILIKLLTQNGNMLDSAGHFLSPFGFPYEVGVGADKDSYYQEIEVFGAKTAGLAVRKNVFNRINGFDEDYFIHGEDTDLSWRIWLAGYKIIFLPGAIGYHYQKGSLNKTTEHLIFYEGTKNNISNIIKNAKVKVLLFMLPLQLIFLLSLSVKLVLQKRFKMARYVIEGITWNTKNIKHLLRKRDKVAGYTKNQDIEHFFFGPFPLYEILLKGIRWFIHA